VKGVFRTASRYLVEVRFPERAGQGLRKAPFRVETRAGAAVYYETRGEERVMHNHYTDVQPGRSDIRLFPVVDVVYLPILLKCVN